MSISSASSGFDSQATIFVLDAGGTGFTFSAVKNAQEQIQPFTLAASGDTLEAVLQKIIKGFEKTMELCQCKPTAISFCFPGPADYINGIIGDLENLPHFRGGVPLKAMLEAHFKVPVFINNDGDLFAYGEALAGLLPEINRLLEQQGNPKRYNNLLGLTLGTGFGGGIMTEGRLLRGDNSAGGEINRMRNFLIPATSAEDSISIRAVKRVFAKAAGIDFAASPTPFDIYEIAMGRREGNRAAALEAWDQLAIALADTIANAISLVDGLVVIGGGLSGAWPVFMPRLVELLNKPFVDLNGKAFPRMEIDAFNLQNETDIVKFTEKSGQMIRVPFSEKKVWYDPAKKTGIGISRLGTTSAVAVGAYAYAIDQLKL
ncbi:MAG: ROK family protein [Bacteroidetes bacterium]|nr:ROK family protein [Bacteroidota bacterium]MBU1579657.1 ROK family protein [Bacteroidota bacterium]MBU2465333.1 ROK family protein [Bacteroidota bacterium]MBU2557446.1 ROK family protein [Bacteroidota bacterium]